MRYAYSSSAVAGPGPRSSERFGRRSQPQFASHAALDSPPDVAGMHLFLTHWYFAPHSVWQSSRGRPLALGTHASFTQAKGEPQTGSVQLLHLQYCTSLHTWCV